MPQPTSIRAASFLLLCFCMHVCVGVAPLRTGTVTTLSTLTNPTVFTQAIPLTATVAPATGAGTPTGSVTFFDGGTNIGFANLAAGTATFDAGGLSVAPHVLTAVYNGDSTYATSTSAPITQVVKVFPVINLASAPNPSIFGQAVSITVTIVTTPGAGTPTGTVTFNGGPLRIPLATLPLVGGTATLTLATLAPPTYDLSSDYSGDNTYFGASTTLPYFQTVGMAASSTLLSLAPITSIVTQPVTLTATVAAVAPGAGTCSGFVTFFDRAISVGTGTLVGGVATMITSPSTPGGHSFTATYSGDSNFVASAAPPSILTVICDPNFHLTTTTIQQGEIMFTGGFAPYLLQVTGAIPPGTMLAITSTPSVLYSGIPQMPGLFTFGVQVVDATGCATSPQIFVIDIPYPASFEPPGSAESGGLSRGGIAGIVIGCVVGAVAVGAGLYFLFAFLLAL
jgi:hypothetical protein